MATNFLLKRSGTASKRPEAASMALGELDINYDALTGGLFYKDSAGGVVKVGPAQVGLTAPNSSPAGSAGNSVGEFWYDTGATALKIWDGTTWVTTGGGGGSPATPTTQGTVYGLNDNINCNTAVGFEALNSVVSDSDITAVGYCAGAVYNGGGCAGSTFLGSYAGNSLTAGDWVTAVGSGALGGSTSSYATTVVGGRALQNNITGEGNTALGYAAGLFYTGSCSVIIGYNAEPATQDNTQLVIGSYFNNWLTGDCSFAIKPGAGIIDCAGSCGTNGQVLMSNGANAVCWGTGGGGGGSGTVTSITAGTGLSGGTITTSGTISLDTSCVIQPSILTAKGSLISASGVGTPIALSVGTNGQVLTACSSCASGLTWTTSAAGPATPVSRGTLYGRSRDANSANTSLGYGALNSNTSDSNNSVAIGNNALCSMTGGDGNVAIGNFSARSFVSGAFGNIAIGGYAMCAMTAGCENIAIGCQALSEISSTCGNIVIGHAAATSYSGCNSVIIGRQAQLPTNCDDQLFISGGPLGCAWLTGNSTQAIKPGAGIIDCANSCGTAGQVLSSTGGNRIEWVAPPSSPTATPTVEGTVYALTDSTNINTALGFNAMTSPDPGSGNVVIGTDAGSRLDGSGGSSYNVLVGVNAGYGMTTGVGNIAHGTSALMNNPTGNLNIAIGYAAGSSYTGSSSILIGPFANPATNDDYQLVIGNSGSNWLVGDSTLAIRPGAGIRDGFGSIGTAGQFLTSTGMNSIAWQSFAPPNVYTSSYAVTTGTPLPVLRWTGTNRMGTLTAMAYASDGTRAWANIVIAASDPEGVGDSAVTFELTGLLGTFTVEAGVSGETEIVFNPIATVANVDFNFAYTASFGGQPTVL